MKPIKEGDTVFTSLLIIKDGNTLYTIADNVLYNKKGVELTFDVDSTNKFYGYRYQVKSKDHIDIIYLSNGGINVSDNIDIVWNNQEKIFEMFKAP